MDIVQELQKDIADFNNAKVVEIKKTYNANYKGNQNDLNKFMSRIAYLDYVRSTKKNKNQIVKKEYDNHKSAEEIHAILEKQQFFKPWSRLDKYCRKIKNPVARQCSTWSDFLSYLVSVLKHSSKFLPTVKISKISIFLIQ